MFLKKQMRNCALFVKKATKLNLFEVTWAGAGGVVGGQIQDAHFLQQLETINFGDNTFFRILRSLAGVGLNTTNTTSAFYMIG